MSTSATGGSGGAGGGPGGDRPKGFQRFMRRASSVLKRDKSKRQSIADPAAVAPVTEESAAATTSTAPAGPSTQPTAPSTSAPPPAEPQKETKAAEPTTPASKPPMTVAEIHKAQVEKARALFAKYNLTLEEGEWTPVFKGDATRVEKKVRMRIHRHCHRCQNPFGVEKVCSNCKHNRCKKCPRTPISSRKDGPARVSVTTGSIVVDDAYKSLMGIDVLAMPYRRTAKELINPAAYKRTCHKCQRVFSGNAPQCGNCGHSRCALCPRDPPMAPTLTDAGLPRRRQMRSTRVRIRYTCHECKKTFRDLEKSCSKCGHEKCDSCPSDPGLDQTGPTLDADALRSVEERLRALEVSPQAAAA